MAEQIPPPNYGSPPVSRPKQGVIPIDIVAAHIPEQHTASQIQTPYHGNSHTVEVARKPMRSYRHRILLFQDVSQNNVFLYQPDKHAPLRVQG